MPKNNKIINLKNKIARHNELYYNKNEPEISDYDYDILKSELKKLEANQDDLFSEMIGAKPEKHFAKIAHKVQMLSLDNAFNEEDVKNFDEKIKRFLGLDFGAEIEYIAELKIDGLSFSAVYKNGNIAHVATRGDGQIGEDVTQNVLTIADFPQKIDSNLDYLEVRGEIYISHADFEAINARQLELGEKPFLNPRNAASGSLRVIDANITKSRNLKYFAYSIIGDNSILSQKHALDMLKSIGFNVQKFQCGNTHDIITFYNEKSLTRHEIGYDVDGVVYKVNDFHLQKRLGNTNSSPRWAIAHKFPGTYAVTKIISILHQVGRLGNITPVAELSPINIGGVVVKRATLHNYDETHRLGIGIGSVVKITRAGDVIPRISEVIDNKNVITLIQKPTHCPCCNAQLHYNEDEVAIRCINSDICRDQIIQRLAHFASKDAFNIVGLGEKQVERFYDIGLVKAIPDIFLLKNHARQISELDRMGIKSTQNLIASIESSRQIHLNKIIYALSIPSVGEGSSAAIANKFATIEQFMHYVKSFAPKEEIANIDGVGTEIANEMNIFFTNANKLKEFEMLLNSVQVLPMERKSDLPFLGKKIIFTGTLTSMTRQEAKKIAQDLGLTVSSSVTKDTDFVVAGESSGSKLKLAKELNIEILDEAHWCKMCGR